MSGNDMEQLQAEVQQVHALLLALEISQFHPTLEDLSAFHAYLREQQTQSEENLYPGIHEQSM